MNLKENNHKGEDKAHTCTKDISHHLDRDDLSLIIEQDKKDKAAKEALGSENESNECSA